MEKAINRKMEAISLLINQYKALIELNIDKVSKCLKNEYYFKQIEEDLEEIKDDFEELKKFYFNLGVEFRSLSLNMTLIIILLMKILSIFS